MTSRTNRHSVGRNRGGAGEVAPADLEYRRQLAVKRYLDGDPIERICQEMGCSMTALQRKHRRLSQRTTSGCARRCRQMGQGRSALT